MDPKCILNAEYAESCHSDADYEARDAKHSISITYISCALKISLIPSFSAKYQCNRGCLASLTWCVVTTQVLSPNQSRLIL